MVPPLYCGLPSPLQGNCETVIPPFVGISLTVWNRTGGGHTGTRWRGDFSTPFTQSADNGTILHTHTHKVPAKGFERAIAGRGAVRDVSIS